MNIKYILTRIKTKKMNIRMCLFLSRTPSLEYNIIHITLLSENKWNLLMIYFYLCRHVSIIIYINYTIFNGHGHYLIFSLCYCRRNVSPHCHMFTSIKRGGATQPTPKNARQPFPVLSQPVQWQQRKYPLPVLPLALAMLFSLKPSQTPQPLQWQWHNRSQPALRLLYPCCCL